MDDGPSRPATSSQQKVPAPGLRFLATADSPRPCCLFSHALSHALGFETRLSGVAHFSRYLFPQRASTSGPKAASPTAKKARASRCGSSSAPRSAPRRLPGVSSCAKHHPESSLPRPQRSRRLRPSSSRRPKRDSCGSHRRVRPRKRPKLRSFSVSQRPSHGGRKRPRRARARDSGGTRGRPSRAECDAVASPGRWPPAFSARLASRLGSSASPASSPRRSTQ